MASAKLTRTNGTATTGNIYTWSAWVKRGLSSTQETLVRTRTDDNNYSRIRFDDDGTLVFEDRISSSTVTNLVSNAQHRDLSSWYHVLVRVDYTQATAGDRARIYVNGSEVTYSSTTRQSQSGSSYFNSANSHDLGHYNSNNYFNGSMTHVHFTDGYSYAPSTFGETDSTSGIWKPKTAPSVTYGNNGYFLKMENSGAMGTDSSGNSNTFTVSGTLTQNVDTPSNNFATFNPLRPNSISQTYSNGNNTVIRTGTGGQMNGTLGVTSGKWYYECLIDDYWQYLGWTALSENTSQTITCAEATSGFYGLYSNASAVYTYVNGSNTSQGSYTTMASGQTWGIAFDADNAKMYFSVNGVWENSSDPANQTNPAITSIPVTDFLVPAIGQGTGTRSSTIKMNFGQGFFGTTAVASAGTAPSEGGIFEYDCPSGYQALCTKGINSF